MYHLEKRRAFQIRSIYKINIPSVLRDLIIEYSNYCIDDYDLIINCKKVSIDHLQGDEIKFSQCPFTIIDCTYSIHGGIIISHNYYSNSARLTFWPISIPFNIICDAIYSNDIEPIEKLIITTDDPSMRELLPAYIKNIIINHIVSSLHICM